MRNQVDDQVLEAVREFPNISRSEIHKLMEGTPQIQVNYALDRLAKADVVKVGQKPSPAQRGPRMIKAFSFNPAPRPCTKPRHDPVERPARKKAANPLVLDHLRAEIEKLRAWKADAIARYPDLSVDPLILAARKMVVEQDGVDPQFKADILAGRKDGTLVMRVAIEGLSRAAA